MSHPTSSDKPSNPANPRVFFDVDIGGERGQDNLILMSANGFLKASLTVSLVSLAPSYSF